MHRFRAFAVALTLVAAATPARPEVPALPAVLQVLGSVTNAARPVGNVLVIALNLTSLDAIQTFSANDGTFVLPPLPAAVYRIIAVKSGFLPAMAMILPTQRDQRIALRLDNQRPVKGNDPNQAIWELRASLPPDVLHELDDVLTEPVSMASASPLVPAFDRGPRFRGEMMSLTGVADATTNPAVSQTAVGMDGRIGDDWQIGFRGNLHRIDDPANDSYGGEPLAQSSGAQIEVRSSPTNAYRVATTNSSWRYTPQGGVAEGQADIHANNFEWEHGDDRVQVRYFAQQNLFAAQPGSELVEVAGNTTVMQTAHSDVGVFVRVAQESVRNAASDVVRTADLTANASLDVAPALVIHYGLSSRLGVAGGAVAPRTGAELRLGSDLSFVVSGQYKVVDETRPADLLPAMVVWSDESRVMPRYAYSFGFVSGDEKHDRFSAVATVTAIDSPMRLVFSDGFEQFWDGLYLAAGDLRRDLRVSYRKELSDGVAIDLSSSAGNASSTNLSLPASEKSYISGDIASTYQPTGTSLAVSYRRLRQPQANGSDYGSDRVNVRVAQALHLPLDLKLLLGFEVAHAQNSPFLLDSFETDGVARRYIGGLAVSF